MLRKLATLRDGWPTPRSLRMETTLVPELFELELIWRDVFLAISPIVIAVGLHWLTQAPRIRPRLDGFHGVAPPYFVSVGLLFGLFAAFLGDGIWDRVELHDLSLEHEADAILEVQQMASAMGDSGEPVQRAVKQYVRVTLAEEWRSNQGPHSAQAENALGQLAAAILDLDTSTPRHLAVQTAMLGSYKQIRKSRATRRRIVGTRTSSGKWTTVMLLGFLTQASLVAVHLDRRRAQAVALTIFTMSFVVAVVSLASNERPLSNPSLYSMTDIERLAR